MICNLYRLLPNDDSWFPRVTYESRRVVITDSLGVTKGFQYRVSLYDLIFQGTLHEKRIV